MIRKFDLSKRFKNYEEVAAELRSQIGSNDTPYGKKLFGTTYIHKCERRCSLNEYLNMDSSNRTHKITRLEVEDNNKYLKVFIDVTNENHPNVRYIKKCNKGLEEVEILPRLIFTSKKPATANKPVKVLAESVTIHGVDFCLR